MSERRYDLPPTPGNPNRPTGQQPQPEPTQQPPSSPKPESNLRWWVIGAAVLLALVLGYSFMSSTGQQSPQSSPTGAAVYNQPEPAGTGGETATGSSSAAPKPSSTIIGGTQVNANPTYPEVAPSVIGFCKAWATANQGKETMLNNLKPYVTSTLWESLQTVDARNTATDGPTLTNIIINKEPNTDSTYSAYCVYNQEAMPRYGGIFIQESSTKWVLSRPEDALTDPNILPDRRPKPERTGFYDLNQ